MLTLYWMNSKEQHITNDRVNVSSTFVSALPPRMQHSPAITLHQNLLPQLTGPKNVTQFAMLLRILRHELHMQQESLVHFMWFLPHVWLNEAEEMARGERSDPTLCITQARKTIFGFQREIPEIDARCSRLMKGFRLDFSDCADLQKLEEGFLKTASNIKSIYQVVIEKYLWLKQEVQLLPPARIPSLLDEARQLIYHKELLHREFCSLTSFIYDVLIDPCERGLAERMKGQFDDLEALRNGKWQAALRQCDKDHELRPKDTSLIAFESGEIAWKKLVSIERLSPVTHEFLPKYADFFIQLWKMSDKLAHAE